MFGLQRWISPHSQPVAGLVLGKIQPSVVFSGAPETLANLSLPTGSISPRVFYICCRHWFYLPSVWQRRSYFLPYSSLQFSLLPGITHSFCFTSHFFFFFVNNASSCVSQVILSAVCTSNFFQAIFLHVVRVLFTTFGTFLSSPRGFPCDVHIFGIWSTSGELERVGLDSLFAFSDGDSSYVWNS